MLTRMVQSLPDRKVSILLTDDSMRIGSFTVRIPLEKGQNDVVVMEQNVTNG